MEKTSKPDWSGEKYLVAKELGECIDMVFGRYSENQKKVNWYLRPHNVSDGIGGFTELLKRDKIEIGQQPQLRGYKTPHVAKRLRLLYKHIRNLRAIDYPFKSFDPSKKGVGAGVSYCFFTKEQSDLLLNYCRSQKVSITSLLLWALDKAVVKNLLMAPSERAWLVPLNFRGKVTKENESGNFTSSMTIRFSETPTLKSVHSEIRSIYKSGMHWGAWILSNLTKYVGKRGLKYLLKNTKPCWIGVCSNMGDWPPAHATGEDTEPIHWLGAPPVTSLCPVSCANISWRGKLGLTLQLHPSLSQKLSDSDKVMQDWVENITSENIVGSVEVHSLAWSELRSQVQEF